MSQEDAEKEIGYDCLRTIVDDAIKTKNICTIESLEVTEKKLRYMQKYAELQISKEGLAMSYYSIFLGIFSVGLAFFAIGISYILVSPTDYLSKLILFFGGLVLVIILLVIISLALKMKKEFKNKNEDIKFTHEIILKIEEKLPDGT